MIITSLATHPIKSLRPISVPSLTLTPTGPLHDRQFLLLRPGTKPDSHDEILSIGGYSQLCLFRQSFHPTGATSEEAEGILIEYHPPRDPTITNERAKNGVLLCREKRTLLVPLHPQYEKLDTRNIDMHHSSCIGYDMGDSPHATFFTECLGFPVRLVYLGDSSRKVLGNVAPRRTLNSTQMPVNGTSWWKTLTLGLLDWNEENPKQEEEEESEEGKWEIRFADCAPLLITTTPSLDDVSRRFQNPQISPQDGRQLGMDMSKFRPNIVVGPTADNPQEFSSWDEDFWAELLVNNPDNGESVTIELTQNCGRCRSINVDFETGSFAETKNGGEEPLKYLMKDRRVDSGVKYSPIFGRYGFLKNKANREVSVGDKVVVSRRNKERTTFEWPGL